MFGQIQRIVQTQIQTHENLRDFIVLYRVRGKMTDYPLAMTFKAEDRWHAEEQLENYLGEEAGKVDSFYVSEGKDVQQAYDDYYDEQRD